MGGLTVEPADAEPPVDVEAAPVSSDDPPYRLPWRVATLVGTRTETPTATTLELDVPGWRGAMAGQHVDVRLTAEDGYSTQRSYSLASPGTLSRPISSITGTASGETCRNAICLIRPLIRFKKFPRRPTSISPVAASANAALSRM